MLTVGLDEDPTVLTALAGVADGLVVAALGGGHVPGRLAEPLSASRAPVVLASRVRAGRVLTETYRAPGSESDLLGRGLLWSGFLGAAKARVLLVTALACAPGAALNRADLRPGDRCSDRDRCRRRVGRRGSSGRARGDPAGAAVVDEEAQPVRGQPHVSALPALSGAVAGVGLPAVMSSAERAGVVGAGLTRGPRVVVGDRVVVVDVAAGGGRVGPVVTTGDQVDPFLERLGVLIGGGPDPVGQVDAPA